MTKCIHSLTHLFFLKLLHLLYNIKFTGESWWNKNFPLNNFVKFAKKNVPSQIYEEGHAKALYAFQIFLAQKLAINLRLLAHTLVSLVGGEGEASCGCEVSQSHPFKSCLFHGFLDIQNYPYQNQFFTLT